MHFQLQNHIGKLLGAKSLNTKQFPAGLSPTNTTPVNPFLAKNFPSFDVALLLQPDVASPPFVEPLWETLELGK